jgi:F5/8 type C domain
MARKVIQINTSTGELEQTPGTVVESSEVATAATASGVPRADAFGKIHSDWIPALPIAALPVASSGEVSSTKVVRADDSRLGNPSVGGDLTGTALAATVVKIQGRAVSNAAPANGDVLVWDQTTLRWEPGLGVGVGGEGGGDLGNPMIAAGDLIYGSAPSTTNVALVAAGASIVTSAGSWWQGSSGNEIIDGSEATQNGATSASTGVSYTVTLEAAQAIVAWRVNQSTAWGGNTQATSYKIQSSADGVSWVDNHVVLSAVIDSGVVPLTTPANARYWRLVATAGGGWQWIIKAFELHTGIAPGTPKRLPVGSEEQILTVVDGTPAWASASDGSGSPASLLFLFEHFS